MLFPAGSVIWNVISLSQLPPVNEKSTTSPFKVSNESEPVAPEERPQVQPMLFRLH